MRAPVDMLVPVSEGPRCECGALLRTVFRQVSLKKLTLIITDFFSCQCLILSFPKLEDFENL
jgi:hypothetical protein